MNKKIILLLIITCIISAIAFKAFAGTAGGSGLAGVGPNCSAGNTSTPVGLNTTNVSITTAGFSTSTITLNVTCATPASCYNSSATNLVINNDTVLKSCDGRTKEYLAQNITGNFTNVSNVQVSASSLDLVATTNEGFIVATSSTNKLTSSAGQFIPNYGTTKENKFTETPSNKRRTYKENGLMVVVSAGVSPNNKLVIAGALVDSTNAPVAAIAGKFDDITLSAGYTITLGEVLITEDMKTGTYGDYAITYITVYPGAGGKIVSYLVSFNIDTNLQTIAFAYSGQATKCSDPGNDVVINSITQLYTSNGLKTDGLGYYADTVAVGTTQNGVLVIKGYSDAVVAESSIVKLANLEPLTGQSATYIPYSTTSAFGVMAINTVTKAPILLTINDANNIDSITTQSISGATATQCGAAGTDPKTGEQVYPCYDSSIKAATQFKPDTKGTINTKNSGTKYTTVQLALLEIAMAFRSVITMYTGTNTSEIIVSRSGSGNTFQSSVLESNFVGDSLAALGSSNTPEGQSGSWVTFVAAGRSPDNTSILLGYFNTSMEAYAINPNGTMQFTTDRIVAIQTIAPDINILNFQLRWQNFTGTFDTTMGTCIGCTFDAQGTCQAEVEKIWGMYNNYNITINLTPSTTIKMQDLQMCCRGLNQTVGLNTNCSTLLNNTGYGASTYSTSTCFTPASEAGKSYNTSDTTCVYLQNLTAAGVQTPLGTIQPSPTCEMIACEINGTWNSTNDKTFTINKTITVTAI